MKNSLVFCAVIWIVVVLHTSRADNEPNQQNDADARQPRFSGLEEPIFLIRPVTKDKTGMRNPTNRKSNPMAMSPSMMGNGFVIRAKTDGGEDDERVVKEFISHFGQVVTRIDHGNSRKVEPPKYISLPPNVNYFIKTIQKPQTIKKFSTQSNLAYRYPRPNVVHQRPAGFLKKRNIKSEPPQQMTPQFRASPQIGFSETISPIKTSLTDIPSSSDDWTPTSSITSPTLMHAVENKQYQNQQFFKSKKEKTAYTHHLMDDFRPHNPHNPSQSSFTSMTVAVADNKVPSFQPKVTLRVAAADEKIKNRTRLKPVREIQEESDKHQNANERVPDQYGEENVENKFESETSSPVFVTPVEVTTKKTTKFFKHRSSSKLNDSCETTCLMNIVNLDYDPLCGSNDHTYMNVGKFRCAKICGQLQLTIKHFGSCEDSKAIKV